MSSKSAAPANVQQKLLKEVKDLKSEISKQKADSCKERYYNNRKAFKPGTEIFKEERPTPITLVDKTTPGINLTCVKYNMKVPIKQDRET